MQYVCLVLCFKGLAQSLMVMVPPAVAENFLKLLALPPEHAGALPRLIGDHNVNCAPDTLPWRAVTSEIVLANVLTMQQLQQQQQRQTGTALGWPTIRS